ncbi:MAG: hypothetical protein V3V00_10935 [Saprospiraceae bacterium]
MSKPRVIKAYDAIDNQVKKQLRIEYPYGFQKRLISFKNAKGKLITALPYETEDRIYLIKMTNAMAAVIMSTELEKTEVGDDDDDYQEVMDLVGEEAELELDKEVEETA